VIPVIAQNYNANDARAANIHVVIPVIDRNYDMLDIVTANLAKSLELYRDSGD
jgi:hypothetical protein